jgi:NAD(P)-dependent dehydrogenase (short-subunit alcohol dehydrogenase family)
MNEQRHALVTGGARGIGAGIAAAMLNAGYAVTVTGLTGEEVGAVPARPGLEAVILDVTDQKAVDACIARLPRLHALVNCAGIILRAGAEYEIENFRRVIEVNLTGTMRMCVAAKPLLERQGGAIVNTASILSYFGGPLVPAYTASKGGVVQLTKALAVAWAPAIRVNAIAPGWIETELTRPLTENAERSDKILARTPAGRWGQPDDVGGAVVYLCSDAARFVTGALLPIDGGYAAM